MLSRGVATESRLTFGLAHEMCHAAGGRDSIGADEHDTGAEESEANKFAHAVLVGPHADRMFKACMGMCASGADTWDIALLRQAVLAVAREEGARADSLANYVAHRLADESYATGGAPRRACKRKCPDGATSSRRPYWPAPTSPASPTRTLPCCPT